jgi:hypothetical protein
MEIGRGVYASLRIDFELVIRPKVSLGFNAQNFEGSMTNFFSTLHFRYFRSIATRIRGLDIAIEDVLVRNQPPPG